jgi:hypothetical protein
MAKLALPSLQASDAFYPITPSDSGDITDDAANIHDYKFVYLHNYGTAGLVYVSAVDSTDLTTTYDVPVFIPQGGTCPLLVRKVWATGLGAGVTLTAFVGRGGKL